MKKVSKPLGAGLLIVAVLLMILFIFAQTAQLPSGSGDDNFWYVLAGCIILTATLCTLVFFTLSRQQNPSPVTPDGENNPNEESASDQYDFSAHIPKETLSLTSESAYPDRMLPPASTLL